MARVQLFLCFTVLFASVTLLDIVAAHLNLKPSLPQIEDPKTIGDVEPYTVKVVMVFVSDLEKQCPKTSKFKAFFEKLRAYAKYVMPIKREGQVDYDQDMNAKAGGLFKTISSFAIGKIRNKIQEEKAEAVNTFRFMRSVGAKILGGRKKEESEESMKLTAEQQKEIKEGILRWETVITRITNTMVMSTNSSSSETSTTEKGGSSANSESSSSGSSNFNSESSGSGSSSFKSKGAFDDTTGSSSNLGSPTGSPSSSPSGSSSYAASGSGSSSFKSKGSSENTKGSSSNTKSSSTSGTSSTDTTVGSSVSQNAGASQSSSVTVQQVEADTSKEITTFIMNLEKKCPSKEEYKAFFEQLKGTMIAPLKEREGLFSRIRSAAAGRISGAMTFLRSRIGSRSAQVKQSMETYQGQVMKTLQELSAIHGQIVSQNRGKGQGSLTCTPAQQTQIKQTITKWEQVTTQFVEVAIQSETQSSSTTSSTARKMQPN